MSIRLISPRLLISLLLIVPTSHAQSPDLRAQMGAAEFKAAGLDKLDAAELASLETWLGRELSQRAGQALVEVRETAREEGRREVIEQHRGFFHFDSDEPISSPLEGEFNGFAKGRRYRLGNGQLWEQTDTATLAGVRRNDASVQIRPGSFGVWWMQIDGFNTRAKVKRVE